MKIIFWGADQVGKSALLVRFVTGRYISEYSSLTNYTVTKTITPTESNVDVKLEVTDPVSCVSTFMSLEIMFFYFKQTVVKIVIFSEFLKSFEIIFLLLIYQNVDLQVVGYHAIFYSINSFITTNFNNYKYPKLGTNKMLT